MDPFEPMPVCHQLPPLLRQKYWNRGIRPKRYFKKKPVVRTRGANPEAAVTGKVRGKLAELIAYLKELRGKATEERKKAKEARRLALVPYAAADVEPTGGSTSSLEGISLMVLDVDALAQTIIFGPGIALANEAAQLALEGGDPLVSAAEATAAGAASAVLEAALVPEQVPFLDNPVRPEELEGHMWQNCEKDEESDQESDNGSQGKGLPPWQAPTTGDFAATLRGVDERDAASDDLALSDIEPEMVAKASVWQGDEDQELPVGIAAETDWEMRSAFSKSTGASFYKVGDADLQLPPVPDVEMPAATAPPAASSSDAPLP